MPTAAAAPAAQAAPVEEAQEVRLTCHSLFTSRYWPSYQEKPKEKTIFNVKLESFDATAKPKIIREVKALIPNLTLMDVRTSVNRSKILLLNGSLSTLGKEVCGIASEGFERELAEGRCWEVEEDLHRPWRCCSSGVDLSQCIYLHY